MNEEINLMKQNKEAKPLERSSVLHQSDILPGTIKARHLDADLHAIKFGVAADKPSEPRFIKAWFETDTDKLCIYNGSSWVCTTLS